MILAPESKQVGKWDYPYCPELEPQALESQIMLMVWPNLFPLLPCWKDSFYLGPVTLKPSTQGTSPFSALAKANHDDYISFAKIGLVESM